MAQFKPAFDQSLAWEGKFLENVAGDPGGLTFWGVARNVHKTWPGWSIIDSYIQKTSTLKSAQALANADTKLIDMVSNIYKVGYWDALRLDQINNQLLANNVFDAGLNMGVKYSIKNLQNCIGQIEVDGVMGPATIQAANSVADYTSFVKLFQDQRAIRYRTLVEANPSLAKFLVGWLRRAYAITA